MTNHNLCTIADEPSGFAYWVEHPAISTQVKLELAKADVIVLPYEGFREYEGFVFPVGTEELFLALRQAALPDVRVDIAVDDSEFREIAQHSELLIIADLLLEYIVAPVVVSILADYLVKRLRSRHGKSEVRASVVIQQENGQSTRISYQGPAATFEASLKHALDSLLNRPKHKLLKKRSKRIERKKTDGNPRD